jgi:hypothetical protein
MVSFLKRLTNIVDDSIKCQIGYWVSDGDFLIPDRKKFIEFILPYKFSTLIRQLNYYDFKMNHLNGLKFGHKDFNASNYKNSLLKKIDCSKRPKEKLRKKVEWSRKKVKKVERSKRIKNLLSRDLSLLNITDYDINGIFWFFRDINEIPTDLSHSLSNSRCGSPILLPQQIEPIYFETIFNDDQKVCMS